MSDMTDTRTVVFNDAHGGFGLSREALHRLRALGNEHALAETDIGERWPDSEHVREPNLICDSFLNDIPRDDPHLLMMCDVTHAFPRRLRMWGNERSDRAGRA